ncbi:hypothetical protein LCGC14_2118250 [marine sediment metagenome]|uniref:Transposase InsH N-terminal domain-containing protein n=1 Tax=marine sediment metagenome TaxID=412755 RepID=A0A0F9E525_9ZZZZ
MKPKKINHSQSRLFETRLTDLLNPKHQLLKLSKLIDWDSLEKQCSAIFIDNGLGGHPPKSVRLVVGILMLQHIHKFSDEEVVEVWVENPYRQFFCGFDYLQWEVPMDPTCLIKWRHRLGEEMLKNILEQTVVVALKTKTVKKTSLQKTTSDTTVMEKNVTFPTDAKLYDTGRRHLVKIAEKSNIKLRQNYNQISKKHLRKIFQYAHAKQYKRMKKEIKKLKNYLCRVKRDVERKWQGKEDNFYSTMSLVDKLLSQEKNSKNKIYSFYHPEVECISKGKAHKKYEFGCKVAIVTTHREGLCLSIEAMHGNPYDGHTLSHVIQEAEMITKEQIKEIYVDRGYKGAKIEGKQIYRSGQKKGITPYLKKLLKRRQAIEPHIGHMKFDGKMHRNYLKGKKGDKHNALLVGIGHNLRMILRKLRLLFAQIIFWLQNYQKNYSTVKIYVFE